MDDVDEYRARVRAFLDARYELLDPLADDRREDIISRTPDGEQAFVDDAVALQRELAAAGLAAPHVPEQYGGLGLTRAHLRALEDELRRYDAPSLRPLRIGMHLVLPTLLHAGSEEQKLRYLPPQIPAEEQWCHIVSEPDAGSDLVALRTRGERDGDDWVLDGQKVWSSYAARADLGLLLARTNPDAPKPQAGITMFVLPMHAPGVTVCRHHRRRLLPRGSSRACGWVPVRCRTVDGAGRLAGHVGGERSATWAARSRRHRRGARRSRPPPTRWCARHRAFVTAERLLE